ncbi:MAG: ABC transporter substrate-binding protein [Clostridium sp.]
MLRKFLATVLVTVMTASLVGCGSKAGGSDEQSKFDPNKEVSLQFWGDWTGDGEKRMDKMIEDFNKEYPNIKIDYVPYPELTDKLLTSVAAGESPDILFWDRFLTPTYAEKGFLLPIDDLIKKNNVDLDVYYKSGIDEFTYKDKLYGLPVISDTRVMAVNTKMFKDAGVEVPTTWDELIAAGKKLTVKNSSGKAEKWLLSSNNTFSLLPYMMQAGGFPVDKDGNLDYDSEAAKKAIGLWDSLLKDGSVVFSKTELEDFVQGKAAIMIADPGAVKNLAKYSDQGLEYKFVELPTGANGDKGSLLGGFGLAIPKASKNQEAAFTFVNWWASNPENAGKFVDMGSSIPSVKGLKDQGKFKDNVHFEPFLNALEYAAARPTVPWWEEVDKKVIRMNLELFVQGKQDAESTLKKIQEEGNALIKTLK